MIVIKKIIWLFKKNSDIAIALMAITHINLGFILAQSSAVWWEWAIAIAFILIVAEIFASPWSVIKTVIYQWLKSDVRSFFTTLLSSLCVIVILSWFDISTYGILIILATALARIELQNGQLNSFQEFLSLSAIALGGLLLGAIMGVAIA
jgi:hypothetical protein